MVCSLFLCLFPFFCSQDGILVAQDEFDCWSPKDPPTCPDDYMTEIVLATLGGLTVLFILHDHHSKPEPEDIGCIDE